MFTNIYTYLILLLSGGLILNVSIAKVSRIIINEASDFGIKLAICQNNNHADNDETRKVSEIITEDLNYSGQFKVNLLASEYSQNLKESSLSSKLSNFDFKFWRDLGSEYLLVTKLYKVGSTRTLGIRIQLIDLYKPLDPVYLIAEVTKHPKDSWRDVAHKISDIIFEKLIGIRGIFRTKIAYIKSEKAEDHYEYSLNIADFDGVNEHKLLTANYPIMSPKWSPDSTKIAFVSFKGNRSSINVIDLKKRRSILITKYPGINGAPAWSPKGDKLALVLSKDGNPAIYILNLLNNELYRLTKGIGIDTEPCWSNNEEEIFFTSNRGGKPQIYKINLSTKIISRVTFKGEYNATPVLTPDNKYLVMLHCDENCSTTKPGFKIALQSLETGSIKLLTSNGTEDNPTLAPNGIMVMYTTRLKDYDNLVLASVSIEGNTAKYLPVIPNVNLKSPTWSSYLE